MPVDFEKNPPFFKNNLTIQTDVLYFGLKQLFEGLNYGS
jgi:hypothetical protein